MGISKFGSRISVAAGFSLRKLRTLQPKADPPLAEKGAATLQEVHLGKLIKILVLALLLAGISAQAYGKPVLTDEEKLAGGQLIKGVSYDSDPYIAILDIKTLIKAPPERIWGLLGKVNRWSYWMPHMLKGWIVGEELLSELGPSPEKTKEAHDMALRSEPSKLEIGISGKTEFTVFEEYDLPWPIRNDWTLQKYDYDATDAANGRYKVAWNQILKGAEDRGGTWNMSRYNEDPEETLFIYHLRVKRMKVVPKAIFEVIMSKTADKFITAIRRNTENN